jgi:hypothetical protein
MPIFTASAARAGAAALNAVALRHKAVKSRLNLFTLNSRSSTEQDLRIQPHFQAVHIVRAALVS